MYRKLENAQQLIQHSKYDLALKELNEYLATEPNDGFAYYLKALIYSHKADTKQALENAEKSISLEPDQSYPYYIMSLIQFNLLRKFEEADKFLREAIRLEPDNANYYGLLALTLVQEKMYKEAIAIADDGLKIDPENVDCKNSKSIALTKLKRSGEAQYLIDEALNHNPEDFETLTIKGWNLLEQGNHKEALVCFSDALKINPNYEYAKQGLINALKARNFIFRIFLKYYFWIGNMGKKAQWGVILGIWVVARILQSVGKSNPEWMPYVEPVMWLYLAFVVLTWTINPIFNLFLRFNKFGKYALDKGEIMASNLVAGFIGAALTVFAFSYVLPDYFPPFAALALFAMILPVSGTFNFYDEKKFRILAGYSLILTLLIIIGMIMHMIQPGAGFMYFAICLLGIFIFTWVANFLV